MQRYMNISPISSPAPFSKVLGSSSQFGFYHNFFTFIPQSQLQQGLLQLDHIFLNGDNTIQLLFVGLFPLQQIFNGYLLPPQLTQIYPLPFDAAQYALVRTYHSLHDQPRHIHFGCFQFFVFVWLWFCPSHTVLEKHSFLSFFTILILFPQKRFLHGITGTKGICMTLFLADIVRCTYPESCCIHISNRHV